MSEQQADYLSDAMEMMGAGYDQPAAVIDPPRTVNALRENGIADYKVWGWVKTSSKFRAHIKILRGAKHAIWHWLALSVDETGKCKETIKSICEGTGYSHTEVIDSLKELDAMGYLSIQRDTKGNVYNPQFVARGGNVPSEVTVKKLDSTPAYQVESSPSEEKSVSSYNRVKRVKHKISGIEAAMFQERKVEENDLLDKQEQKALEVFERDMQLPSSWEWYPVKASKEKEWRLFREFVIKTYRSDPQAFEKYNTWRNQPFVKGAKSNTQIKDYPADFEVSWSDYLRSNTSQPEQSRTSLLRTL